MSSKRNTITAILFRAPSADLDLFSVFSSFYNMKKQRSINDVWSQSKKIDCIVPGLYLGNELEAGSAGKIFQLF